MMYGDSLLKKGKCLLLAYDQGFEHGPTDFSDENTDPDYIVRIAKDAGVFTGIVFQSGVAEKYYPIGGVEKEKVPPLIVKLNGKTSFHKDEEPVSLQLCSVQRAMELGATAVGYTIYVGSEYEETMMKEFGSIVEQAHDAKLGVIAWMYPRGKHVTGRENSQEVVAYAARLGLELGADMVKLPFTGDAVSFAWVVKNSGKTEVLVQGGARKSEGEFLKEAQEIMAAGAAGMAVGRNIWQSENPIELAKKLAGVVFGDNI